MICSSCEKPIDDLSSACPHCGATVERTYCPTCGQALGGGSNKKGMIFFMSFVIIALIIVFVVDKSVQFSLPTKETAALPTDTRPDVRVGYDIITKNSITIGDTTTEEWMIHVNGSSDSTIVEAGLSAIEEAKSEGSYGQISVYVYVGDAYTLEDQTTWIANLTYVRPDRQDTALMAASEKIGEDVFIRWNR